MNIVLWCVVSTAAVLRCAADAWQFPAQAQAASVRIDTKVHFIDEPRGHRGGNRDGVALADEASFNDASDAEDFYERPAAGRPRNYHDGTLDSLQYCKCVGSPDCNPGPDSNRACGAGKYLCCYKKPNKIASQNTEYFNEIEDERPSLLPGRGPFARPFPAPPSAGVDGAFGPGHGHDAALLGAANRPVLTGPSGPTGVIGPGQPAGDVRHPAVLVGPGGPTGVIGPGFVPHDKTDFNAPERLTDTSPSEAAQRGVLVGPGGPTGIIGPAGYGQRPRLVGPGGPTGFIGPRMRGYLGRFFNEYMGGRQAGPGVLVGPGGPTGVIGPAGRPILAGPGGPTGIIGPQY